MSNNNDKKTKKDDEWKPNPKVTMRFKKNGNDDWTSNEDVVMHFEETQQEDAGDDSK